MASRRRAREWVLQALYQVDIAGIPPMEALESLWATLLDDDGTLSQGSPQQGDMDFARELVQGVFEHRERIETLIEQASLNWRLSRMPAVDRNILRMACYEILERPDIPVSVTINEAVELAKRYGGADSRAFVNGILDRVAFDTGRGGRGPKQDS